MRRLTGQILVDAGRSMVCVLRAMPISGSLLLLLMLMPSSIIFGERSWDNNANWIKGSVSWFDFLIGGALIFELIGRRVILSVRERLAFVAILIVYLSSWWASADFLSWPIFLTVCTHWLRFLFGYIVVRSIATRVGVNISFSYINIIGVGVCASSIFVALQAYERMPRIYGAGMTVASFSQFLAILIFINICQKNWRYAIFFAGFILLTLSRTSFIALLIMLIVRRVIVGKLPKTRELAISILLMIVIAFGLSVAYEEFYFFKIAVDGALNPESLEMLGGRVLIWDYAYHLWVNGYIPWSGVGVFGTEKLLWDTMILFQGAENVANHFHSIIFEALFGAGWPGLILLAFPLIALYSAWRRRSVIGVGVYGIFLITQSFDFTLYRPKEELIWGALLGFSAVASFINGKSREVFFHDENSSKEGYCRILEKS